MKNYLPLMLFCFLLITGCSHQKKMTPEQLMQDYKLTRQKIDNGEIKFAGGDGTSFDKAVVIIGAKSPRFGIKAEYIYLEMHYGKPNVDWRLVQQSLAFDDNKFFDILEIVIIKSGKIIEIYYDISDFRKYRGRK